MKTLTIKEKRDYVNRCEFHKGTKDGVCPTVSIKEARKLEYDALQKAKDDNNVKGVKQLGGETDGEKIN